MEYISQEFNEIKKLIAACHNRKPIEVRGEFLMVCGYWPITDVPPEPITYGFKLKRQIDETIRTN